MKLILCLDEKNGISFNNRRQSRDCCIISDICKMLTDTGDGNFDPPFLYISPSSKVLFEDSEIILKICDDPVKDCPRDGTCFLECPVSEDQIPLIHQLVIYRWQCSYPADKYFSFPEEGFEMAYDKTIQGYSHETIIKEVYIKKEY